MNIALVDNQQQQLPATLDRIESAIAIANKPEEINAVLALMDAAVAYAQRFYKDQHDVIQRAKSLRLHAERKLGELLRDMPKASGSLMRGSVVTKVNHEETQTLADIGIDKRTSSRAQKLAALPEKKFAAVASGEISVAKAIAAPSKKSTEKSRTIDSIDKQKIVVTAEGSSYLISAMRGAFNALESTLEIQELNKAIAMAEKLHLRLTHFIKEHQGQVNSL